MSFMKQQENAKTAKTPKKQYSKVNASWIPASLDFIYIVEIVCQEIVSIGIKQFLHAVIVDQIVSGIFSTVLTNQSLQLPVALEEENGSMEFADLKHNLDAEILTFLDSALVPSVTEEVAETV